MSIEHSFHPEALFEYGEAAMYYLRAASPRVADAHIAAVESAVATLVQSPARWSIVEHPEIRRYIVSRFPFVIYYRWEPEFNRVGIFAVMHCSRDPHYWRHRVDGSG